MSATLGNTTATSLKVLNDADATTLKEGGTALSDKYAAKTHTHTYAGSASAGGAATSANKVNAALTFNNGGSGAASGTTFDGSSAKTISYNTVGAAPSDHNHDGTYLKSVPAASNTEVGGIKIASPFTIDNGTLKIDTFGGYNAPGVIDCDGDVDNMVLMSDGNWKELTASDVNAAAASHTHAQSDVNGLESALNGKASASHTHNISDVTDLIIRSYTNVTGTAATTYNPAKWDVTDTSITEYKDGMVCMFRIPVAGSSYGTKIQINNLGYHPVRYGTNSEIGSRYPAGSSIVLVYNANATGTWYTGTNAQQSVTGIWQISDYNSDTTASSSTREYYYSLKTAQILYRYRLAFTNNDATGLVPYNTVYASSTSNDVQNYAKALNASPFDPFGSILYWNKDETKSAGTIPTNGYMYTLALFDARYSMNLNGNGTAGSTALTSGLPVFIKAIFNVTTGSANLISAPSATSYLERSSIVQVLPTSSPGRTGLTDSQEYIYVYLGTAYSKYQIAMSANHPVYHWDAGLGKMAAFVGVSSTTNEFRGSNKGLVPSSDENTQTQFLRGDGEWGMPSASDVSAASLGHKHSGADITTGTLSVDHGGTGSTTASGAIKTLLNSLDGTTISSSDADKFSFICKKDGAIYGQYDYYTCGFTYVWDSIYKTKCISGVYNISGSEIYTGKPLRFFQSGAASVSISNSNGNYIGITIGATCLEEGTMITMADNSKKPIELIQSGDVVLSMNPETKELTESVVLSARSTGAANDYNVMIFENGAKLYTFGRHRTYAEEAGYPIPAEEFKTCYHTPVEDGESTRFFKTMTHTRKDPTNHYDLLTSNNLYFANGILCGHHPGAKWRAIQDEIVSVPEEIKNYYYSEQELYADYKTRLLNDDYVNRTTSIELDLFEAKQRIQNNKQELEDSDYITIKHDEGLVSEEEWAVHKQTRSELRKAINTDQGLVSSLREQLDAVKKEFGVSREKKRQMFNDCFENGSKFNNDLKAYFAEQKIQK